MHYKSLYRQNNFEAVILRWNSCVMLLKLLAGNIYSINLAMRAPPEIWFINTIWNIGNWSNRACNHSSKTGALEKINSTNIEWHRAMTYDISTIRCFYRLGVKIFPLSQFYLDLSYAQFIITILPSAHAGITEAMQKLLSVRSAASLLPTSPLWAHSSCIFMTS